jgi:hypothetical protein
VQVIGNACMKTTVFAVDLSVINATVVFAKDQRSWTTTRSRRSPRGRSSSNNGTVNAVVTVMASGEFRRPSQLRRSTARQRLGARLVRAR